MNSETCNKSSIFAILFLLSEILSKFDHLWAKKEKIYYIVPYYFIYRYHTISIYLLPENWLKWWLDVEWDKTPPCTMTWRVRWRIGRLSLVHNSCPGSLEQILAHSETKQVYSCFNIYLSVSIMLEVDHNFFFVEIWL